MFADQRSFQSQIATVCISGHRARAGRIWLMAMMDSIFTDNPTYAVLRIENQLKEQGLMVNEKRIGRQMGKMGQAKYFIHTCCEELT